MMAGLADLLLGPLIWLVSGLATAIGIWWAATSRANAKADADRLARDLAAKQREDQSRKEVKNAINDSKSGGDGWHKRLSDAAAKRDRDL